MLDQLIASAVNHLLDGEEWARARLQPFAGSCVRFELGPFTVVFSIDGCGFLAATESSNADVLIQLPEDAPLRLLTDRESVFGAAKLSGAADLAETLGFVFRNLRWDPEADLARFTGDIAARRIAGGVRTLFSAQHESVRRFSQNLVEYAADETGMLIRPNRLAAMSDGIAQLSDDLARLERRVLRLRE